MKEGLIHKKRNGAYVLENTALIGYDYLWKVRTILYFFYIKKVKDILKIKSKIEETSILFKVIIEAPQNIANNAIEILKEIYTNLGNQLRSRQVKHKLY